MTRATRLAQTNVMAAHFAASGLSRWTAVLSDYWTLTKPEVNFLILITTFAGFYLASPASHWRILLLFNTLLGTMLDDAGVTLEICRSWHKVSLIFLQVLQERHSLHN